MEEEEFFFLFGRSQLQVFDYLCSCLCLLFFNCVQVPTIADIKISSICGALRDLVVPFVQFKKREKHPWRSVNFSKVAGFTPFKLYKWYIPNRAMHHI